MDFIDAEHFLDTGTLSFTLHDGDVEDSDEVLPGFLVDYGKNREILRIDIWNAQRKIRDVKTSYRIHRKQEETYIYLSEPVHTKIKEMLTHDDRIRVIADEEGRYLMIRLILEGNDVTRSSSR